jgi:hypothetical protein
MKRHIINLFSIFVCLSHLNVSAQQKNYYRYVCAGTNEATDQLFKEYVLQFGHSLERDASLDSFVYKRASYFLKMLHTTVDSYGTLYDACLKLPKGDSAKYAHRDYYGRPDYFIKPSFINYDEVDFLKVPPINGNHFTAEIMFHIFWSVTLRKQMNKDSIMNRMFRHWHKKEKKPLSLILLDGYIDSERHHEAIIEDGNGKYGMVTIALLIENKISNNLWEYEVMMLNMVNFTRRKGKRYSY